MHGTAAAVLMVVVGCAPTRRDPNVVHPSHERGDTTPTVVHPLTSDGEEDIFPDPWDRTAVRMAAVRRRLETFARRHGRFPDTLADALPPGDPRDWRINYGDDAWGTPFRYRRRGSDYELISAGADRQFGTADDLIVTRIQGTKWG